MTDLSGDARSGGSSARVCDAMLVYWPANAHVRLIIYLCCSSILKVQLLSNELTYTSIS